MLEKTLPKYSSLAAEPPAQRKPLVSSKAAKYALYGLGLVFFGMVGYGQVGPHCSKTAHHGGHSMAHHGGAGHASAAEVCIQYPPLKPESNTSLDYFKSESFRKEALEHIQGAVRIPTQSYDDMGEIGEDKRWEIFYELEKYFKDTWPVVFDTLEYETVNTHGQVFTWKGSDESLEPMVLMAHQDVVPVLPDTADLWTYPPFSATFDGEFIWGRGVCDCKNTLTGIMDAITLLIKEGFEPARTVIIGYGFDEEISGPRGAKYIAKFLEDRYGPDSMFAVLDEGGLGLAHSQGINYAAPAIGEKGYYDAEIIVHTAGGHSSMPPDHTGIGIISQLIELIENTPHKPDLIPENPTYENLKCYARFSETMDPKLQKAILSLDTNPDSKKIVVDHLHESIGTRYLVQTSQATDIIGGGLKINALPEKVSVVVNHRIDYHQSVKDVQSKLLHNLLAIAHRNDLAVLFEGKYYLGNETSKGTLELTDYSDGGLEPAPVSPTDSEAWKKFAGTIRHVFQDFGGDLSDITTGETFSPDNIIITPSSMLGNTDTKYYWNLTRNVWRFTPNRFGSALNAHTVDERLKLDTHVEVIYFYHQFLQNIS